MAAQARFQPTSQDDACIQDMFIQVGCLVWLQWERIQRLELPGSGEPQWDLTCPEEKEKEEVGRRKKKVNECRTLSGTN